MTLSPLEIFLVIIIISQIIFILYLLLTHKESFVENDPKLLQLNELMTDFFERHKGTWNEPVRSLIGNKNPMKEISLQTAAKSYTINKQAVHMCMKEEDGDYYPDNTLIYVLAHELAHVICDETGHTEKYNTIFDQLLLKLQEDGLYDPSIYINRDYCEWTTE